MKRRSVPVTQLSEVAVCERRVYLASRLGRRTTEAQDRRMAAGTLAHANAFKQSAPDAPDPRCFIATAVYGSDSFQTNRLRAFRDGTLRKTLLGRLLIQTYYLCSPPLARFAERRPIVATAIRVVLNAILRHIK